MDGLSVPWSFRSFGHNFVRILAAFFPNLEELCLKTGDEDIYADIEPHLLLPNHFAKLRKHEILFTPRQMDEWEAMIRQLL